MNASNWPVLVAGLCTLAVGCSGTSGPPDGAAGRDGPPHESRTDTRDAAPPPPPDGADATEASDHRADAGTDIPIDGATVREGGGDDVQAETSADGRGDGPVDALLPNGDALGGGGLCGDAACKGSNWAQWPMPNTASDVANGAPHPAMLADNGDDTVSDGVTSLMWQRTASVTWYNRAEAQMRCQRLRAGGHQDWRVPSAIELTSIIDFDKSNSSIDEKVFPDSPIDLSTPVAPVAYFGTTTVAGTPPSGWLGVFSYGGIVLDTTAMDRGAYLRCVRGPRAPENDTSAGRYDLSIAGTARDLKTGLTWQRMALNARVPLSEAKATCATKTGLPGMGWRLPTMKELMTLVDYTKNTKPRLDEAVFNLPTDGQDSYGVVWSATSVVGKPPYSQFTSGTWALYSDAGQDNYIDSAISYAHVRCVR